MKSISASLPCMVSMLALLTFFRCSAAPVASYSGDVGSKNGWRSVTKEAGKDVYRPFDGYRKGEGGRIESPRFKLDKKDGENACYRLTFEGKSAVDGYWWVDMFDRNGKRLPDVNSRLFASDRWKRYDVMVPMRPDAVEAVIAMVSKEGAVARNVSMRRASVSEVAEWCAKFYKKLPQLDLAVPPDAWAKAPKAREALLNGKDLNVVLLGDSIMNDTYCGNFTSLVQNEFPKSRIRFTISVRGSTGCWYYHEEKNFEEYVAKYKPDLVLIGGISNLKKDMAIKDAEEMMTETIRRCQGIGAEVIVCTPAPSADFRKKPDSAPFDRSLVVELHAPRYFQQAYERRAARRAGVQVWDMTLAPCEAISRSGKPLGWFARDAIHSNDRGKQLITQTMAAYFRAARNPCPSALVADPYRAVDIKWKKHPVKGKDFWLLFAPSIVLDRPGVSELPMVRESGTQWVTCGTKPLVQRFYRTITLKSVKGYTADGKETPVKFTVTCDDPKAVVWEADNGSTVVSGPIGDTRVRYLPIAARLTVNSEKPLAKIVLGSGSSIYGTPLCGRIDSVSGFDMPATWSIGESRAELVPSKPVTSFACDIASAPYRTAVTGLDNEKRLAERLRNAPFTVYNRMSIWGMLNMPHDAVDKTAFRKIAERYPDTFLGIEQTEWDANFLQKLTHGKTDSLLKDLMVGMKIPCTRDDMIRNLYRQWHNYGMMNGPRRFGMSGGLNFQHFGLDAGGCISCYEITDLVGAPKRLSNRTNFSAARQWGVPSQVYMAYFANACHATADPRRALAPNAGEDFGCAPCYGLRNYYLCYYMGINYLEFESQPWGQTKYAPDGKTFMLTKNGEAIQDIFNWSKNPAGARGDWYAPILLLKDRRNADDGKYAKSWQPFAFYNLFPATEGDVYSDMIDRVISPGSPHPNFNDPRAGTDLVNSPLADIFCHYMADPINRGEVDYEDLAKYPVVIVAGDFAWTETLANKAKKYVAGGGTLVLTAAQAKPFDALFLGYAASDETVVSDGLVLQKGRLAATGKTLVATSDKKLPLVVKSVYGAGNVIYVTAPNFRRDETRINRRNAPPQQLKELLYSLQDAVVPVKFSGPCNAVYNRLEDGTWKILLVNHDGIAKKPNETHERFFPEYSRDVTLTLPEGATAKEVRTGAEGILSADGREVTYTLPPAGIFVVEVKGASFRAKPVIASPQYTPVYAFSRSGSSSGLKNDGYRCDPAAAKKPEKPPAVIGEWLAKNRFKDSSGNGHDLVLTGPIEFKGDVAVFKGGKPPTFGNVSHFKARYAVPEGTFETWVKPDLDPSEPKKETGGVFAFDGDSIRVAASKKGWQLVTHGAYRRVDVFGPKVENKWTHVLVTFKDEILRFYIDGTEVKGENGPMRRQLSNPEGRNTFYETISMSYGTDQVSWGSFFRGEGMGLKYTSRYTTPEEAKKLAAKRW